MIENRSTTTHEPSAFAQIWSRARGPVLVGFIAALIAIVLSLYWMITNPQATPLTVRSFLLVVIIAGGAWGLVAFAVASVIAFGIAAIVRIHSVVRKSYGK